MDVVGYGGVEGVLWGWVGQFEVDGWCCGCGCCCRRSCCTAAAKPKGRTGLPTVQNRAAK